MKRPLALRATLGMAAASALTLAALAAAPASQASTLYACAKKNGSAHIFTKKPKCKKGETKLSWNTAGPAGKNGAAGKNGSNGSNGLNGKDGAPGQPQKGVGFNQTIASPGSAVTLFTLGEVAVKLECGNFIVNVTTLLGSAPTGSLAEIGLAVTNSEDKSPEIAQTLVRETALSPSFGAFMSLTSNLKAPVTNKAHLNGAIVTPTATVLIDAYLETGAEPKACVAKGAAFSIPS